MMHPGDEYLYGPDPDEELLDIVDRILEYTCAGAMSAAYATAVICTESYIEQGIADFENYLGNHAAFEEFMTERSETDA